MIYDVAFLGAGPGGYVGAIRGGQLGSKIILIEEGELGGACLNRGCIPSKSFYASATRMEMLRRAPEFGVRATLEGFDLSVCVDRKDTVVADLVGGVEKLLKGNGVEVLRGRGSLISPEVIQVKTPEGRKVKVEARNIILSTGSRPMELPGLPVDGTRIVTSDQIWGLRDLPARMVIVGGGVIGCELAHIFSAFGTKVTVVELLDRILYTEDKEASRLVAKKLAAKGVEIRTGVAVEGAETGKSSVRVTLKGGEAIDCDRVAVAVGRRSNTEGLGFAEAGVGIDAKGRVEVNDEMETAVPGIYAVGDVVGKYMLAHVATSEAMVAVHNALGKKYWMDY